MATLNKKKSLDEISTTIIAEKGERFKFNETKHRYTLDDKPLTGVTTILQVISKPALIQWAADETAKHLGWYNIRYTDGEALRLAQTFLETQLKLVAAMDSETYLKFLSEARIKHIKHKQDAGTIGTNVHAEIERLVKNAIKYWGGFLPEQAIETVNPDVVTIVLNFMQWAIGNKVKFLESEKRLYSEKHWYAGTVDLVFEMGGKRYIGDIKTSNAIYNEHFFQMAAYEICLEEMGTEKVDGYLVINIKKDGTIDLKVTENRQINKEAFLHALGLYKLINSIQ